jgi:hypothetical protein
VKLIIVTNASVGYDKERSSCENHREAEMTKLGGAGATALVCAMVLGCHRDFSRPLPPPANPGASFVMYRHDQIAAIDAALNTVVTTGRSASFDSEGKRIFRINWERVSSTDKADTYRIEIVVGSDGTQVVKTVELIDSSVLLAEAPPYRLMLEPKSPKR